MAKSRGLILIFSILTYHKLDTGAQAPKQHLALVNNHNHCLEAQTRAECVTRGCTFDCAKRVCAPIEYTCAKVSSDRCFHMCNDKESCDTFDECEYDDTTDTCKRKVTAEEMEVQAVMTRHNAGESWKKRRWQDCKWEYLYSGRECIPFCDGRRYNSYYCKCNEAKRYQICALRRNKNHYCCKPYRPPVPPPPTPSPPAHRRTTRPSPTTTLRTTTLKTTTVPTTEMPTTEMPTTTLPTTVATPGGKDVDGSNEETTTMLIDTTTVEPAVEYCRVYDKNPNECRQYPACGYSCDTEECLAKSQMPSKCQKGCAYFCHDPCGCKAHARGRCEYHVPTGQCQPRLPLCVAQFFIGEECGKAFSFYADGGVLCFNDKERGNCENQKNVFSVNANGRRYVDNKKVEYLADNEVSFVDNYGSRQKFFYSDTGLKSPDKYLYEGVVSAIGKGMDRRQCLVYTVPLKEVGQYELAIKTFEPFVNRVNRRLFNIELHEEVIVPDLDIFALAGKDAAVNIVVNFNVTAIVENPLLKKMKIRGFESKDFMDSVELRFCIGDCRLDKRYFWEIGNYLVSAFSLVKL